MKRRPFKGQKKILLVEDEPLIRQVVTRYLGILGYRVFASSRGEEGLKQAQESTPDAVIMDYRLPDMSGLEFYRTFLENNGRVPAILTSAYKLTKEDLKKVRELGIKGFLGKPFNYYQLKSLLLSLFRRPHLHLSKPRFYVREPVYNLNPLSLAKQVFRKVFREGLDLGGHVHFHVRGHQDQLILLCSRHSLGKIIAKSPDCGQGECVKWEDSSFAEYNPQKILWSLRQDINLVRVDAADYEMSWPTLADFLCWLELSY